MKIIQKIPIKQVLTESSKTKIENQFHKHKVQLEQECQQLQFEQRKLQHKSGVSKEDVTKRFHAEISKRKDKIKWIDFQIEQLDILPLGSEITEDEVEALVEVNEGLNWDELMKERAIIVKDGTVIRIK
ncbi:YlqD family protein [Aquibacillus sp. 3ASR75-11]|uniref:YlqD family protein n=1 Tax=Terrihalobacillus insolitus TaxID=2950438 RepID=A0A9X3WTJ4_9BACI|nr:YlqD family protein [Terrihalobacillus insolitus]MDC3412921.1 YlqD family protein [Terrihalobacillus insolitus]MDC3423601.1 YlqD family protein [Terrihalobacillus insolitus]